ncbi:MAG: hypothetical protein ACRDJC_13735 [Thermomicrobiales bacterium]
MVETKEDVTIELDPKSELAKALITAGRKPVTFVSNGRRHVASRNPFDPVSDHDPEAFREALRAVVGTLTPEEGGRLKQDIYRGREKGSRPMNQITKSRTADDDVWANLDPERIRAAGRAVAGTLNSKESEPRQAPNHEGREQGF